MGASRGLNNSSSSRRGGVEGSVGTLVWVRRRNGSWWPGRILGPEELSGSHLLSPRSGTPVKLLGREDASVDWYNIEKSKRVKAFRCGEFEGCINRAKSVAGLPTKNREKYARREDAIVHALELEKRQIEQNQLFGVPFLGGKSRDLRCVADNEFFDDIRDGVAQESVDGKELTGLESPADVAQSVISIQKFSLENLTGSFGLKRDKKLFDSDWEDDTTEATPRMRGLQDFGLRIASSKSRKTNYSNACEDVSELCVIEKENRFVSCLSKRLGYVCLPNSAKATHFSLKRKRSHAGSLTDENAHKRRDRRRPLTQVLESSAKLAEAGFPEFELDVSGLDLMSNQTKAMDSSFLQSEQERKMSFSNETFNGSSLLGSSCGKQVYNVKQASLEAFDSKQEINNPVSVMDNSCSTFSDHLNADCCDARALFPGSQVEKSLSGLAAVDTLLNGPAVSLLSGPAHTGSAASVNDTGLDELSSVSVVSLEKLPHSSNFPLCSNNIAEAACYTASHMIDFNQPVNKITWTRSCFPHPLKCMPQSNASPNYPYGSDASENQKLDLGKRNVDELKSSFYLSRTDHTMDLPKVKKKFSSQGLTLASKVSRSHVMEEDEAESMQATPGFSVSPLPWERWIKLNCAQQFKHEGGVVSTGWKEGLDETGFGNLLSGDIVTSQVYNLAADSSLSKWQVKGKRNARVSRKRPFGTSHGKSLSEFGENPNTFVKLKRRHDPHFTQFGIQWRSRHDNRGQSPRVHLDAHEAYADGNKPSERQSFGGEFSTGCLKDSCCKVPLLPDGEVGSHVMCAFEVDASSHSRFRLKNLASRRITDSLWLHKGFHDSGQARFVHSQETLWIDVRVNLQSNYQVGHVPLVSMMSQCNGKAVVGHSVVVERLYSRYQESHLGVGNRVKRLKIKMDSLCRSKLKKWSLQPIWKTARRTTMHQTPQCCPKVVRCNNLVPQPYMKGTGPFISKLHHGVLLIYRNSLSRESSCILSGRKLYKKVLKKVGLSSQKIRNLSSIGLDHNARLESTESVSPLNVSELSSVACIPMKIIFSRIKEALSSQSMPMVSDANRLLVNSFERQEPA